MSRHASFRCSFAWRSLRCVLPAGLRSQCPSKHASAGYETIFCAWIFFPALTTLLTLFVNMAWCLTFVSSCWRVKPSTILNTNRALTRMQEICKQRPNICSAAYRGQRQPPHPIGIVATNRLHVAPMMGHTDCAFRYLMRLLNKDLVLWTEMVVATELLYKARQKDQHDFDIMLRLSDPCCEPPTILQLGGSNPEILADAVRLALPYGYDEINLNCGCPGKLATKGQSSLGRRVMSKDLRLYNRAESFGSGAAMMRDPELVRDCTTAMAEAASAAGLPVSVKCRIGVHDSVDDMRRDGDHYETLLRFVDTVASAGHVNRFHVHARSAVLDGLGAYANRKVPPLYYDFVHRLAAERPGLNVTINGGIISHADVQSHMKKGLDVMVGRWVLEDPWVLKSKSVQSRGRHWVLEKYLDWALGAAADSRVVPISRLVEHMELLFKGREQTKQYRRSVKKLCAATNTRFEWRRPDRPMVHF